MFSHPVAERYDDFRALPEAIVAAAYRCIVDTTDLTPQGRILELGAGTGRISRPFVQGGYRYVGIDVSGAMLDQFRALTPSGWRGDLILASAAQLPFAAATFDLLLIVQVLGVIRGWRRAIDECRRVLREEGRVVVGRVEHPEDSLHGLIRRERIRFFAERGLETQRPGAGEDELLAALTAAIGRRETLPPIIWQIEQQPRAAIDANLSGWRVQAMELELQARLREHLQGAVAQSGGLDGPRTEQVSFALSVIHSSTP